MFCFPVLCVKHQVSIYLSDSTYWMRTVLVVAIWLTSSVCLSVWQVTEVPGSNGLHGHLWNSVPWPPTCGGPQPPAMVSAMLVSARVRKSNCPSESTLVKVEFSVNSLGLLLWLGETSTFNYFLHISHVLHDMTWHSYFDLSTGCFHCYSYCLWPSLFDSIHYNVKKWSVMDRSFSVHKQHVYYY